MAEKRESYTKFAIDRGVFGAPSFVIDGEIFWGQDRLDFVERAKRRAALAMLSSAVAPQVRSEQRAATTARPLLSDVRDQRRPERIGAPPQPAEPQAERQDEEGMRRLDMGGGEEDRAHEPGDRGSPAAGDPAIEQAAEHHLLDQRRQHRHHAAGSPRTARAAGDVQSPASCPRGSMPSWLTATDTIRAPAAPSTIGQKPAGRKPSAGRARQPIGATATASAIRLDDEEDGQHRQHLAVAKQPDRRHQQQRQDGQEDHDRPAADGPEIVLDQWVSVRRQAF